MSDIPGTGTTASDAFGSDAPGEPAKKASYLWAWLLVVLAFAGGGLWIWQGFERLDDSVDELQRLDIPGQGRFTLEEGKQSVYYEGEGSGNIRFAIVGPDGAEVPISQHSGEVTYTVGGRSGEGVFGYTIDEAGEYRVQVQGAIGGQVAFGDGVGDQIVKAVVGAMAIFGILMIIAIVLFVRTARQRKRARAAAAPPPPPPPPPPPMPVA